MKYTYKTPPHMEDIHIDDLYPQKIIQNYIKAGNMSAAFEILTTTPSLRNKTFNAFNMNLLVEDINYLEEIIKTDIDYYLDELVKKRQSNIDNFKYVGIYDNNIQYEINNFVFYIDKYYFVFKKPSIGILPTDKNYFVEYIIDGKKGADGLGVNLKFNWNTNTNYKVLDIVNYGNVLYVAKTDNTGKIPEDNPNDWFMALYAKDLPKEEIFFPTKEGELLLGTFVCGDAKVGIGVGYSKPIYLLNGSLWLNIPRKNIK